VMWCGLALGFLSISVLAAIGLFTPKGTAITHKRIAGSANVAGLVSIALLFIFIAMNAWNQTVRPPKIVRLKASPIAVLQGAYLDVEVEAVQPNGDDLTYGWSLDGAPVTSARSQVQLKAPDKPGMHTIVVGVHDRHHIVTDSIQIEVLPSTACHPSGSEPGKEKKGST
jgi:hypothetical protein